MSHKEPKAGDTKAYIKHESKESDAQEMKERKEDPMHEKTEQEEMGKAAHLKHPMVKNIKQHRLINDLAYHLHHPQMPGGPKGPAFPPQNKPKC